MKVKIAACEVYPPRYSGTLTFGAALGQREILLELILSDMWVVGDTKLLQMRLPLRRTYPDTIAVVRSFFAPEAPHSPLTSVPSVIVVEASYPSMSLPGAGGGLPGGMPRLTGAGALDPDDPNVKMVSVYRTAWPPSSMGRKPFD